MWVCKHLFISLLNILFLLSTAVLHAETKIVPFPIDGTCKELVNKVINRGVEDVRGCPNKNAWGVTNSSLVPVYKGTRYDVTIPKSNCSENQIFPGRAVELDGKEEKETDRGKTCIRFKHADLHFEPQIFSARVSWEPKIKWPRDSTCDAEWKRVKTIINDHEDQHIKDDIEALNEVQKNFWTDKAQYWEKVNKNDGSWTYEEDSIRVCDVAGGGKDAYANARQRVETLLTIAINQLRQDYLNSTIKKSNDYHKKSKDVEMFCEKCQSYSFENLKYNLRMEFHFDSVGWKVVSDREVSSSGKICGNPHDEASSGYIIMQGVERTLDSKGTQQRYPWTPELARQSRYVFNLDSQPPYAEWIIDPREGYHGSPQEMRSIPSEKFSVRVPIMVSEDPLGCEEAGTQPKPVSSVPQVTNWLTRFTPLPTAKLSRCE